MNSAVAVLRPVSTASNDLLPLRARRFIVRLRRMGDRSDDRGWNLGGLMRAPDLLYGLGFSAGLIRWPAD